MKKRLLLLIMGLVVMLSALTTGFTPRLLKNPPAREKSVVVTNDQQHVATVRMKSDTIFQRHGVIKWLPDLK